MTTHGSPRTLNFFTALGDEFGAGIAGKGFALALADLGVDVRLDVSSAADVTWRARISSSAEVDALELLTLRAVAPEAASFVRGAPLTRRWLCPADWPRRDAVGPTGALRGAFVGHVFCEFERLFPEEVEFLEQADVITTGCDWATRVVMDHGMTRVVTLHQGVETEIFQPFTDPIARPPALEGKFLVFSGGKYEYRKGVDLTIAAFAAFAQRHTDVILLINAYNPWPWSQGGLRLSRHFEFAPVRSYPADLARVLVRNGIPPDRFVVLEPGSRADLARTMSMSNCGLFPIRCEAGTNHFLMEYMACGRPAIATYSTGLLDILRPGYNSVGLEGVREVQPALERGETQRGHWSEPSLEEIVEGLEQLYRSEATCQRLGRLAAEDMRAFAWTHSAARLLRIIESADVMRD